MFVYIFFFKCDRAFPTFFCSSPVCLSAKHRGEEGGNPPFLFFLSKASNRGMNYPSPPFFSSCLPRPPEAIPTPYPSPYPYPLTTLPFEKKPLYIGKQFAIKTGRRRRKKKKRESRHKNSWHQKERRTLFTAKHSHLWEIEGRGADVMPKKSSLQKPLTRYKGFSRF